MDVKKRVGEVRRSLSRDDSYGARAWHGMARLVANAYRRGGYDEQS